MRHYRIAPMNIDQIKLIVVWLSRQYIGKENEIKNFNEFFCKLFSIDEIVIMMVDEQERPYYYGKKEIVDQFDRNSFRRFPWQDFEVEEK
ncbi:MAG: hypothetical protein FWG98_01440 [Candidatus Cloacimonetes bacterium]|nr:hypothetical protein [Candidatus Cloacimonadota bacterium]